MIGTTSVWSSGYGNYFFCIDCSFRRSSSSENVWLFYCFVLSNILLWYHLYIYIALSVLYLWMSRSVPELFTSLVMVQEKEEEFINVKYITNIISILSSLEVEVV